MSGGGPAAHRGPAIAVRLAGSTDDWLLPLDQANLVAQILIRRSAVSQ